MLDVVYTESHFTASQNFDLWPVAGLHTQWPGNGSFGDPTFNAFYKSMHPYLPDYAEESNLIAAAGKALLNQIGVCRLGVSIGNNGLRLFSILGCHLVDPFSVWAIWLDVGRRKSRQDQSHRRSGTHWTPLRRCRVRFQRDSRSTLRYHNHTRSIRPSPQIPRRSEEGGRKLSPTRKLHLLQASRAGQEASEPGQNAHLYGVFGVEFPCRLRPVHRRLLEAGGMQFGLYQVGGCWDSWEWTYDVHGEEQHRNRRESDCEMVGREIPLGFRFPQLAGPEA